MRYVILFVLLLAVLSFACDDEAEQALAPTATTPEPEVTGEPTAVPAESRLLFVGAASPDETGLYSVAADGTDLTLVSDVDSGAVLSPDGERVAFACPFADEPARLARDICVGPVQKTETRVEIGEQLGGIVWEPDSSRLAVVTELVDEAAVFFGSGVSLINADGSDLQELVPLTEGLHLTNLQWSPDGQQLALLATTSVPINPVQRTDLEVVDPEDGTRTNVTEQIPEAGTSLTGVEEFAWAPDGSALAFVRNSLVSGGNVELYTVARDGSDLRQLTDTPDWHEISPAWSPDGQWLAVSAAPAESGFRQVFIVPAAGGEGRLLAPDLSLSDYLVWSPDGRLAFAGTEDALDTCPMLSLYVTNVDVGDPQPLANGDPLVISPTMTWSPDGSHLFYIPGTAGGGDEPQPELEGCGSQFLFSVPADGSGLPAQLTDFSVHSFVGWLPQP